MQGKVIQFQEKRLETTLTIISISALAMDAGPSHKVRILPRQEAASPEVVAASKSSIGQANGTGKGKEIEPTHASVFQFVSSKTGAARSEKDTNIKFGGVFSFL